MKRTLLSLTLLLISFSLIHSCQSDSSNENKKDGGTNSGDSIVPVDPFPMKVIYNNDFAKYNKVRSKSFHYPKLDKFFEGKEKFDLEMLIPSYYHDGEIDPKIKKLDWIGLFKNKEGFYMKAAPLKINMHAPDALFDTIDGQNSGIEVRVNDNKDKCYLLFQGSDSLSLDMIKYVPFGNFARKENYSPLDFISPDKAYSFAFYEEKYTLFAAASKFELFEGEGYFEAKHYQLYIGIGDKPYEQNQLLSFDPDLSGDFNPMVSIDFIGDLDGDSKPDLILDYANSVKYLYLSRNTEQGKLLRLASAFSYWFGC